MDKANDTDVVRAAVPPDEIPRSIFAVSAGLLLMMTFCGCLIIFTGLDGLNGRLDEVRAERYAQLSDVKSAILELDTKLSALVDKLQRIEEMAIENIQGSESRVERLDRLESRVQGLRRRANDKDWGQATPECGAAIPHDPPSSPSQQETGDDHRG